MKPRLKSAKKPVIIFMFNNNRETYRYVWWNHLFLSTNMYSTSWWRRKMETFPRYWPFMREIHRSPVDSPHKSQWHGALMFSLVCAWTNDWANSRDAGDLRLHHAHYDVPVMLFSQVKNKEIIMPPVSDLLFVDLSDSNIHNTVCLLLWYTLRPRQNGHYFENGIFNYIFISEKFCILVDN